jgi:hypothetical protein
MIGWVNFTAQKDWEVLGYIPSFIDEADPRPAKEQINEHYSHGGGWRKFPGFTLDMGRMQLLYPGDPPTNVRAMAILREEVLVLFEHDWFVIIQPDGTWEAARLD